MAETSLALIEEPPMGREAVSERELLVLTDRQIARANEVSDEARKEAMNAWQAAVHAESKAAMIGIGLAEHVKGCELRYQVLHRDVQEVRGDVDNVEKQVDRVAGSLEKKLDGMVEQRHLRDAAVDTFFADLRRTQYRVAVAVILACVGAISAIIAATFKVLPLLIEVVARAHPSP